MTPQNAGAPSPELIFETLVAYQRSAALRAAIELDLFRAIGEAGRHRLAGAAMRSLRARHSHTLRLPHHSWIAGQGRWPLPAHAVERGIPGPPLAGIDRLGSAVSSVVRQKFINMIFGVNGPSQF